MASLRHSISSLVRRPDFVDLDLGDINAAERLLPELGAKAWTPSDCALLEHTKARIAFARKDLERSKELLQKEIALGRNLLPNLGLLAQVECALFDQNLRDFPAMAGLALKSAEDTLAKIIELDSANRFIEILQSSIVDRKKKVQKRTP
ncbi:MAG: hypothetical protein ACLQU2_07260 [Candidatus Binataceae bacterium]